MLWICLLAAAYLALLLAEALRAQRDRARLAHIIHINGIRGKSSTVRLIAAGLAAGGIPTWCKTTGTDPLTIDCEGREEPIRRVGCTNIREQLRILHRAAAQGAQVLVVECMAVRPDLQRVAQHKMLKADIGVLTNVRLDHTDVMGGTLTEIAHSLSATVPQKGVLFTTEWDNAGPLRETARRLGTRFVQVCPDGTEPEGLDFADNVALALAVCAELGVDRQTALAGMRQYHPDPYALSVHRVGEDGQVLFVNALSANDIQSTLLIYRRMAERFGAEYPHRVLLLNNRADRGARARDMLRLAVELAPDEVWLMGAQQSYFTRGLAKQLLGVPVKKYSKGTLPPVGDLPRGSLCFAAGNIAGGGRTLIASVTKEGKALV
ncbi:capsule biosynthesis protein CapB [Oscillibacter valericigenes Sjm18-20]|nr:capsule biosynthesis protein CapB [Oscillibacter valericigenes Sjm18-20]